MHLDLGGRTRAAGRAWFRTGWRRLTASFADDPDYLADPAGRALDPDVPLDSGQVHVEELLTALRAAA